MSEARRCALVMLENAAFIQGELKNVKISDTNAHPAGLLVGLEMVVIREITVLVLRDPENMAFAVFPHFVKGAVGNSGPPND